MSGQREELLHHLSRASEWLESALNGLTEEDISYKPQADKWSIHEIILHVTDFELALSYWIRDILAGGQPVIPLQAVDTEGWAKELHYSKLNVRAALDRFKLLRQANVESLQRITDGDWQRRASHPFLGEITLGELMKVQVDHISSHLKQIERNLAGKREEPAKLAGKR
ncbi:DinB family protein [Paenibacillus sp. P25]|nr:DinB family protein [Paenibacillus sp. P25]